MEILLVIILFCILIVSLFLNREIIKINKTIILFSIVSHIRNKRNYIENFNYTLIRKEEESDSEYILRSKVNELFEADLIKEKEATRAILQNSMKNKTVKEIDEILKSVYS